MTRNHGHLPRWPLSCFRGLPTAPEVPVTRRAAAAPAGFASPRLPMPGRASSTPVPATSPGQGGTAAIAAEAAPVRSRHAPFPPLLTSRFLKAVTQLPAAPALPLPRGEGKTTSGYRVCAWGLPESPAAAILPAETPPLFPLPTPLGRSGE